MLITWYLIMDSLRNQCFIGGDSYKSNPRLG